MGGVIKALDFAGFMNPLGEGTPTSSPYASNLYEECIWEMLSWPPRRSIRIWWRKSKRRGAGGEGGGAYSAIGCQHTLALINPSPPHEAFLVSIEFWGLGGGD